MNQAEAELTALLRRRLTPGAALFSQVGLDGRRLDVISFGLWRSRGFLLEGFEIKSNRRDFLKEVRDGEKAEALARFLDRFWIVCPKAGEVVDMERLPDLWGVLERRGSKLYTVRRAKPLIPEPLTRAFVASLLKRQPLCEDGVIPEVEYRRGYQEGAAEARLQMESAAARESEHDTDRLRALTEFEEVTGLHVGHWIDSGKRLAEDVKRARNLDRLLEQAARLAGDMIEVVEGDGHE